MKYTIDDHGIAWFRAEVEKRCGFALTPPVPYVFAHNGDAVGWTKAPAPAPSSPPSPAVWNYTFFVENGRIKDAAAPSTYRLKAGLKAIAAWHGAGGHPSRTFVFTPNQNVRVAGIPEADKPAFEVRGERGEQCVRAILVWKDVFVWGEWE